MRLVPERNEQNGNDPTVLEVDSSLIRDLFAAFAIVRIRNDFPTKGLDENSMARQAYKVADAMMKERAGKE